MDKSRAKTIQIFLPNGDPRGIRVAELTTRIVQAYLIPRTDLADAKRRPELDQNAVYFLFGKSEREARPIVHIGKTEDLKSRLEFHEKSHLFWKTAVLGISKTQSFTQAHTRYLEWHCIEQARAAGRFKLDNETNPGRPFVSDAMEADILDSFEALQILIATLGYPVFEPLTPEESDRTFCLTGKNAAAVGELVEDGFVVLQGSRASKEIDTSVQDSVSSLREKLLDNAILVDEGDQLRFTQDYLFHSPSGAAAFILGRPADGWTEWKSKEGLLLNELRDEQNVLFDEPEVAPVIGEEFRSFISKIIRRQEAVTVETQRL
jgi:Fe-S cluster biosynthesis and repair protein YggX